MSTVGTTISARSFDAEDPRFLAHAIMMGVADGTVCVFLTGGTGRTARVRNTGEAD